MQRAMKLHNYLLTLGLGTCIGLTACSSRLEVPDAPVFNARRTLTVNLRTEHQTMEGFGASDAWRCQMVGKYWPEEKKQAIADWLFSRDTDAEGNPKGIGLSIWRFYIGAGSMEQGAGSGIADEWRRAECFQNADGTYDWTRQEGQRWFLRAARDRGVRQFLAFSLSAPVHMTLNGKAYSTGEMRLNLREGMMPAYADFLADCVEHLQRQENVEFTWLSPVNEPQWDWGKASQEGTPVTNGEMASLTRLLSGRLSERGLSTRIALGEAGSIEYLYGAVDGSDSGNQIEAFWDGSSPCSIASLPHVERVMTGHSYWTVFPVADLVEHRRKLHDRLGKYPGLRYWQTEYCPMENPGEAEVPGGGGNGRDLGMQTALYVARVIHNDLTVANASSWQWWTALTRADYKDGLIYLDNGNDTGSQRPGYCQHDGHARDSKLLWTLGNWSRFVQPGMKRVEVSGSHPDPVKEGTDVMASAFKDEASKTLVIVAVNMGGTDRTYRVEADVKLSPAFTPYLTSGSTNLKKGTDEQADNLTVPARSVVTFVGKYE